MTSEGTADRRGEVGRELGSMVRLAVPVVIIQLGLMLMGTVDTALLGHYSARALAAGSLANSLCYTLLVLGSGTLAALDPLVSQAWGAGDLTAIGGHLQRGIVLAVLMAIPLGFVLWDLRPLLTLLGQRPEVAEDAAVYCRALIWGNAGLFLVVAFRQTLQAMSLVRPALLSIVVGNLVNALGNYAFIFGHFGFPALGVTGSAHSTSAARWAMFVCLVVTSRKALAPVWRGFTAEAFDLRRHLRLLRLGLPIGFHQAIELFLFLTVALLLGRMGIQELAAHQIALNLASLSFMVPLGIAGAAATRVGNAIGRGDMPGARRAAGVALGLGVGVMALFAVLFASAPHLLAGLYTRDAAVIAVAALLLPVAALFQIFDGAGVVSAGILRGSADTTLPAVVALVGFWLVGLPGGVLLAYRAGLGAQGLWLGLTLGLGAVAVLLLLRIRWRFRRNIARVAG